MFNLFNRRYNLNVENEECWKDKKTKAKINVLNQLVSYGRTRPGRKN
jgi:hypothetical protein